MTDREKVIKGLESLHTRLLDVAMQDSIVMLDVSMVANAIALLKEQDVKERQTTVEVVSVTKENGSVNLFAFRESKDAIKCFCYWKEKGATVTSGEVDIQ